MELADYQRAAALRAAVRQFLRRGEHVARAAGLTPQRHALLLMIKGAPDGSERATVTELSERLQLAQNTVTDLVARSEAAGLLEREPSEHRRARRAPEADRRGRAAPRGDGRRAARGPPPARRRALRAEGALRG